MDAAAAAAAADDDDDSTECGQSRNEVFWWRPGLTLAEMKNVAAVSGVDVGAVIVYCV